MVEHFQVNVVGSLLLFQAIAELLDASPEPKFFTISSSVGNISYQDKLPLESTAYGGSKAALNFLTIRIHYENPRIVAAPINPGWLKTDMGNNAANGVGMEEAPISLRDGVNGIIDKLDKATREKTSGTFITWDGKVIAW